MSNPFLGNPYQSDQNAWQNQALGQQGMNNMFNMFNQFNAGHYQQNAGLGMGLQQALQVAQYEQQMAMQQAAVIQVTSEAEKAAAWAALEYRDPPRVRVRRSTHPLVLLFRAQQRRAYARRARYAAAVRRFVLRWL